MLFVVRRYARLEPNLKPVLGIFELGLSSETRFSGYPKLPYES